MGFNSFANFGDIKGESTDKDHKDWVMILKYDHAVPAAFGFAKDRRRA